MATAAGIVNQALQNIAAQTYVSGSYPSFTDGTPQNVTGIAANTIYAMVRDILLRRINPEFARLQITATLLSGPGSAIAPWSYEYAYPADCVRVRQVAPPASGVGALADPNDPLPIRGAVAYDPNVPGRVILTNQQNAVVVYTSNTPLEAVWDAAFAWAMSDLLSNPLAMALAGRPDFSKELLMQAEQFASIAAENAEL